MVIIFALRWWYSDGWQWAWQRSITQRIAWCSEAFSMSAMVRTWFSPFKQTFSKSKNSSIDMKVQAAVDNLISRIIGSLARTCILLAGLVCMAGALVSGIIIVFLWPLIPLLPILSVMFTVMGLGT